MPDGKPAGVRCIQLPDDERCAIFDSPDRPAVCRTLRPDFEMCGESRDEAMRYLMQLELETRRS
jgi:hypothetical protein